jgi:hypothetical protein
MHAETIVALLHLAVSRRRMAGLLGMFLAFIILPVAIIGFVIKKHVEWLNPRTR